MDERATEKFLAELRDRMSDMLAAVQLLTPLIQNKGDQRDQDYLAVMNKTLYRMVRTIHHMELCGGETILRDRPLDLAGLCRDLCRQCENVTRLLKIEFTWQLETESVISLADERLVELALWNLLCNAFEAAGPGGRVSLRCGVSGGRWMAAVRDDGAGLRAPEPSSDPFLKKPGGLGLGLAAARQAAALHGGALMLENGEERGIRAVLSLPVRKPEKPGIFRSRPVSDLQGGFSPMLVELSPILPVECYLSKNVE